MTPPMSEVALARRLNLFDATMIVMGGIVGAGIFMNPAVVAQEVAGPVAALGAWVVGGVFALTGAFIYAELAARRPAVGGQYAYLREAFHPLAAFLYAWTLLLVSQSGGMAAVAMTFARYFRDLTGVAASDGGIAVTAIAFLTMVNCLGVRAGSNLQSVFMVLKIGAVAMLVAFGFWAAPHLAAVDAPVAATSAPAFGAALVPVLFAYGGWQTASFVAAELRSPQRDLPRGLLIGVSGVVLLYLLVNIVCIRVLGMDGLARTTTPASDVMRAAFGERGATLIAAGIAVSTIGFLSQNLLTGPRVYFAMARDGIFFKSVASVHPRTRVPVVAIVLQGALASLLALSGSYERILGFVVAIDWVFFGLTALALFVLRRRDEAQGGATSFRVPGHPLTTLAFVGGSWLVVANTVYRFPANALAGLGLMVIGVPVYYLWQRRAGVRA
jgi:basic amino acid/polyamine antiporter, APA family